MKTSKLEKSYGGCRSFSKGISWLSFRKKQQEERLKASDFYNANNVYFLKSHPETKRKLIETERIHRPSECVQCVFFKWISGEDKRVCGGQCAAKPEIEKDRFDYGKTVDGCPLLES